MSEMDVDKLKKRLLDVFIEHGDLDEPSRKELVFHMLDWVEELEALYKVYSDRSTASDEYVYKTILAFLLHAPEHVSAAAEILTGEPVQHIFRSS